MNKPSLQTLLQQQLSAYCQQHQLDANRLKICDHLLNCHTPALGGLAYECDHCEREIPRYHSCRDRHCPQCQQRVTRQWAEQQQQAVLPVPYYHLVFSATAPALLYLLHPCSRHYHTNSMAGCNCMMT